MALKFADESQLSQGVTMTLNKFGEILNKLGVEEFGARGEEFDPNLHNGVLHCEDDELGEQIIAEVLQKGYKKGEKIIRYAMVKVAN
jgi:molecular chaperone GrpE